MDQSDFDRLKRCAIGNLRKTSRAATLFGDTILQPTGLKVTQFTLLGAIAQQGSLSVGQLAAQMLMDQTSLTRSLKLLRDMGLVSSVQGREDGRTRLVSVTPEGYSKLDEIMPLWEKTYALLAERLGQEHLERLLAELELVNSILR
jgi:DNA-binding MarR family transcriptional regulator